MLPKAAWFRECYIQQFVKRECNQPSSLSFLGRVAHLCRENDVPVSALRRREDGAGSEPSMSGSARTYTHTITFAYIHIHIHHIHIVHVHICYIHRHTLRAHLYVCIHTCTCCS